MSELGEIERCDREALEPWDCENKALADAGNEIGLERPRWNRLNMSSHIG